MEPKFKWGYFFVICLLALLGTFIMKSADFNMEKSRSNIKEEITNEIKRYPKLQIDDLYKFIHQAALGSEHAVKDSMAAINWMQRELSIMNKDYENNLIDQLSPDGKLVRVNLRPYIKLGYDSNKLTTAFVKTANGYKGSINELKKYWKTLIQMAHQGEINFSIKELEAYYKQKEEEDFPAVHHSKEYEQLYFPAYRVVAKEYLQFLKEANVK